MLSQSLTQSNLKMFFGCHFSLFRNGYTNAL